MTTVHCTLRNADGTEVEYGEVQAYSLELAVAAADSWGRGRLATAAPNSYVEHIWSISKPMPLDEFLDAVEGTL